MRASALWHHWQGPCPLAVSWSVERCCLIFQPSRRVGAMPASASHHVAKRPSWGCERWSSYAEYALSRLGKWMCSPPSRRGGAVPAASTTVPKRSPQRRETWCLQHRALRISASRPKSRIATSRVTVSCGAVLPVISPSGPTASRHPQLFRQELAAALQVMVFATAVISTISADSPNAACY